MTYISPEVYEMPNPTGLDRVIANMQAKLKANVSWLQCIYGRALIEPQKVTKEENENRFASLGIGLGKEIKFPMFIGKNLEPINLMPNDNLRAYSFFLQRDPALFPEFVVGDNMLNVQQPISFICWANLVKIDPSRKYRFTEELKRDLLTELRKSYDFALTGMYETHEKVFEGCTITEGYKQYCKPPYWAIRIDANITFNELPAGCE